MNTLLRVRLNPIASREWVEALQTSHPDLATRLEAGESVIITSNYYRSLSAQPGFGDGKSEALQEDNA